MNRTTKTIAALSVGCITTAACMIGCEEKKPPTPVMPANPAAPAPAPAPAATPAPAAVPPVEAPKSSGMPSIPGLSPETTDAMKNVAGDVKARTISMLQSGLDTVKGQIDTLVSKVSNAPADDKPALETALDKVKTQYAAVTKNVGDLKDAAGNQWQRLAADTQTALDSLRTSVSDLMARFK